MKELLGKLTASLIENDSAVPENLIDKINENIRPPAKVAVDDVHVRAMYIVSDQVNSYGGRFPADEHERLVEFLIDSPVLIGHRKDSLPIARNFHAETIQRDGANWVKVYFYWLKNAEHGEDLRKNIDAGIYKECSISFIFNFPECSVCGSDIRQCRHRPFEKYKTDSGETEQVFFNYRQISKVLETSLVYRGSVRNTSITDQLFFGCEDTPEKKSSPNRLQLKPFRRLWDIDRLDKRNDYIVLPAYESLRLIISNSNGKPHIVMPEGRAADSKILNRYIQSLKFPDGYYSVDCRLIGLCGKERQPVKDILGFLNGAGSSIRRFELKIADLIDVDGNDMTASTGDDRRRLLDELFADYPEMLVLAKTARGDELVQIVGKCTTRYGVEILESNSASRYLLTNKKCLPALITKRVISGDGYSYAMDYLLNNEMHPLTETVYSTCKLDIGDTAELETCAIVYADEKLKLSQPRIVDASGSTKRPDNINLLLQSGPPVEKKSHYTLHRRINGEVDMMMQEGENLSAYRLTHFDHDRLERGYWFLADRLEFGICADNNLIGEGVISETIYRDNTIQLGLEGTLIGKYILRPSLKNGAHRFVFYKINDNGDAEIKNARKGR